MNEKNSGAKINSFIIVGVLAGLVAVLDFIGVVAAPVGFLGVSGFYVGAAFFTAFAVWFRWKALIAMYLGLLLGAIMSGTFTVFAFILALGNVIAVIIPMLLFNSGKFNMELKKFGDYLAFFVSVTILQSIISAGWVLTGFYLFGIMPLEAIKASAIGWIAGDIIVSIVLGIPIMKFLSPVVKRIV